MINDVAIFWDYENIRAVAQSIKVPIADSLIAYSETIGHPRVKKVYSNWNTVTTTVTQALYSLGFDPIHVSMGKPNSIDIKLTVDCMDTAFNNPEITHFILVTGDKDYIPLVNWLKNSKKDVIIIGRADTISEHLILSASEFVTLEELSRMHQSFFEPEEQEIEPETIKVDEAIKCLKESIISAREQAKTTRFGIIDSLMRENKNFNYLGAKHIQKSKTERFSSFTSFIEHIVEKKEIKIQINEGFEELFLLDEDPLVESEFVDEETTSITEQQWKIIVQKINKSFSENEDKAYYASFGYIMRYIRSAKKEGLIQMSSREINEAMNLLITYGFITKREDGKFNPCDISSMDIKKLNELIEKERVN